MHVAFIPYGDKFWIDRFLSEMAAQKHKLFYKKGKEKGFIWVSGQVRVLPFGVYEYVFPKEDLDIVLTTLGFHTFTGDYAVSKGKLAILRKFLKLKKAPKKFNNERVYLWTRGFTSKEQAVALIPIGIREDSDFTEADGSIHEAL